MFWTVFVVINVILVFLFVFEFIHENNPNNGSHYDVRDSMWGDDGDNVGAFYYFLQQDRGSIEAQSYIVTFAFDVVVWIMINEACSFCLSWSLIFIYYYFCVAGIKNSRGQYLKGRNCTKFLYSSNETTTNTNTHKYKHKHVKQATKKPPIIP